MSDAGGRHRLKRQLPRHDFFGLKPSAIAGPRRLVLRPTFAITRVSRHVAERTTPVYRTS